MTKEIALHCMKSASELKSELCEECPIYGQTGSDHCFEDSLQYVIGMLEQEPISDKYEYHIDHTDCIWYGNDSGCPVTCSQYRDGWNDAMDYIFKGGKGYQPYRREE